MIKAVIDTNVILSGILWGGVPRKLIEALIQQQYISLVSEEILNELSATFTREKFTAEFIRIKQTPHDAIRMYQLHTVFVQSVSIESLAENAVRDPKDRMIIACAIAGQADYIVSGDKDLTDLGRYQTIQIVKPAAFLELLPTSA